MSSWFMIIPCCFLLGVFGFLELWERSRKPVYYNPVIFKDDGNLWLYWMQWVCFVGFGVSLAYFGQ